MAHGFDPDRMTTEQRLNNAAHIVAAGILRLQQRKRSKQVDGKAVNSLDLQTVSRLHGVTETAYGECP
ncbi:MAG: hypothetical protein HQL50_11170 [Magnetococcales bacterium]|nr:hypothetical protein [Magnetococcales bacterium]